MEPAIAVFIVLGMLILPAIVIYFEQQKCIGRLPFLGIVLGTVIAGVITNGVSEAAPLASILGLPVIYILLAATVRRLRDMGWSPWLSYISVIPFLCLVFWLALMFVPPKRVEGLHHAFSDNVHSADNASETTLNLSAWNAENNQTKINVDNTSNNTGGHWTEEFKILLEYDPVVKECHEELLALDPQFSNKFCEEVVADRNKAAAIRDRLKAEYKKQINPYQSNKLNDALAQARSLGKEAECEFLQVIKVMGEDVDVDKIITKLEGKYGVPRAANLPHTETKVNKHKNSGSWFVDKLSDEDVRSSLMRLGYDVAGKDGGPFYVMNESKHIERSNCSYQQLRHLLKKEYQKR